MKHLLFLSALALLTSCGSDTTAPSTSSILTIKGSSSSTSFNSLLAPNAGSPTSWKTTFYKAYVSPNANCSSPVLLQDYGASGVEFDMANGPTLFSGAPAAGTYKCLILNFKDVMKFKADATAVAAWPGCVDVNTENTFDIYRQGEADDGLWVDLAGIGVDATGSAATPGADSIWIFASTDPTQIIGAHLYQTATLASPMVVPGNATFYWDANGGLNNFNDGSNDFCWVEEVFMGFR